MKKSELQRIIREELATITNEESLINESAITDMDLKVNEAADAIMKLINYHLGTDRLDDYHEFKQEIIGIIKNSIFTK
jgi:hypothetical protein